MWFTRSSQLWRRSVNCGNKLSGCQRHWDSFLQWIVKIQSLCFHYGMRYMWPTSLADKKRETLFLSDFSLIFLHVWGKTSLWPRQKWNWVTLLELKAKCSVRDVLLPTKKKKTEMTEGCANIFSKVMARSDTWKTCTCQGGRIHLGDLLMCCLEGSKPGYVVQYNAVSMASLNRIRTPPWYNMYFCSFSEWILLCNFCAVIHL